MWHDVTMVARIEGLNEADLVDFALARENKYHIVVEGGIARISTWHVDDLIQDFRCFEAEEANHLENQFLPVEVGCEFD